MTSFANHHAWIPIFISAFIYYTFLSQTKTSLLSYLNLLPSYEPLFTQLDINNDVSSTEVERIFGKSKIHLNSFETIIHDINASFFDLAWVEDANLGRGYLLVSDAAHAGKVWRYEMGGGLVPIGKSLYLDKSGCRSKPDTECGVSVELQRDETSGIEFGSRGICVQVSKDSDSFDMGHLIVVEGGEKRIVRMEDDGARTPLVVNRDVDHILYTPFGDLLFTQVIERIILDDNATPEQKQTIIKEKSIYRVKEVINFPSISFSKNREAHSWTDSDLLKHWTLHEKNAGDSSEKMPFHAYSGMNTITSMAVGKDLTSLFISGSIITPTGVRNVIIKVPLIDEENSPISPIKIGEHHVFYDMSQTASNHQNGNVPYATAIALDQFGNIFIGHTGGLTILDSDGDMIATVHLDQDIRPTGLVFGNDGYLYMTTKSLLLRYKIKVKGYKYPTNLIVPSKKR